MPSEITRLLNQIDQEQQAMRLGLTGLASVARHDFIQAKQAKIDACHSRLIGAALPSSSVPFISAARANSFCICL